MAVNATPESSPPWVLDFADGDRSMADLLGGKGANLAEMTRLGLPVPHGFIVTTAACREYLRHGSEPPGLTALIDAHLARLERDSGRRLGDPADPLLVSVRSGGRFSMPGMMETVLDVGVTDDTVVGLARRGGERFAWDCYRRLVQMYGRTVLGVDAAVFEHELAAARATLQVSHDGELDALTLRTLVASFRRIIQREVGEDLPQDPREQLRRAVLAVFSSWNVPRARFYRRQEGIPDDLGTAVNVVEMVYGNTGPRSGSGVCFTRDPASGELGAYGDYLPNAQGEDVVNGSRATIPLAQLAQLDAAAYTALTGHLRTLEQHYRDLCDVEFTIEDGTLWVLQTRVGKRTAAAAFRIACALVDEGLIDLDEALRRVDGHQLSRLLHPQLGDTTGHDLLATGLPASPGAGVGEVALDHETAARWAREGREVVLVRQETSPDDLPGIVAARAIVTARGGLTSHAAVVARGMGRPCVVGAADLTIDLETRTVTTLAGVTLAEGETVSVDGTSGRVHLGHVPVQPSAVATRLAGGATNNGTDPVSDGVLRLLAHADKRRRVGVRANAETLPDAQAARQYGAEGIGLFRTEHTLLGSRRELVERLVLDRDRDDALREIGELARADLVQVLEVMDGLPVVVRLLDPPLHEFLPDLTGLAVEVAVNDATGVEDAEAQERLAAVRRWHESNPMLGLRGVRLLAVLPELVDVQARAVAEATLDLRARGQDPRPEVMVPLVAESAELVLVRARVEAVLAAVAAERHTTLRVPVGVMVELPRAALTSGRLAAVADFFSFGTNDLTQTTWGMSRDDAETGFLRTYREQGLLASDPFSTLDVDGVGRLVSLAVREGRRTRPDLGLGACGEHAGDPDSVRFFVAAGLDYVSCSPPRVPVARLEAGRAEVLEPDAGGAWADTR
ncbi:pyruvate, phosphate dikinase [Oryzihumus sp.]